MKLLKSAAYGLILCTALAGPAVAVEPDAPEQLITRLDAVGAEVQKRLTASFRADTESKYEQTEHGALVEFYSDHNHAPVWVTPQGLTEKARVLMREVSRAADYGLDPTDYPLPELKDAKDGQRIPVADLANAELLLSRAALVYARHARGGRIAPGTLSKNLDPTLDLPDPLELMEKIAKLDDPAPYLRGFHPTHPQFEALRKVLLAMRGGADEKLVEVPDGPVIRPGEQHAQLAIVRERLKVPVPQRDGTPLFPVEVYDSELEMAIKEFQKSHGLNADGIIGPATRRAMNSRPRNRARTILANMERWRWMPGDLVDSFNVRVNVPEFTVRVFDGKEAIHTERVVVGKVENATPIFSDQMERIEFHPYWNVPDSIKVKEILPHLRRQVLGGGWFGAFTRGDVRFLTRNGLYVKYRGKPIDPSSVNWSNVDIRKFHIYQKPGGDNVLGVVKFMFPNKHTVYMHDTPTKHLFEKPVRAYSHGCMRVRNPQRLAEILLARDAGWSRGRVGNAVASNQHQPVHLSKPVPVHITYFTADVRPDGTVRYFGDLYGHDARMARALKF